MRQKRARRGGARRVEARALRGRRAARPRSSSDDHGRDPSPKRRRRARARRIESVIDARTRSSAASTFSVSDGPNGLKSYYYRRARENHIGRAARLGSRAPPTASTTRRHVARSTTTAGRSEGPGDGARDRTRDAGTTVRYGGAAANRARWVTGRDARLPAGGFGLEYGGRRRGSSREAAPASSSRRRKGFAAGALASRQQWRRGGASSSNLPSVSRRDACRDSRATAAGAPAASGRRATVANSARRLDGKRTLDA